jgi:hypothetical protein
MSDRLFWSLVAGLCGGFVVGTLHLWFVFWHHMRKYHSSKGRG